MKFLFNFKASLLFCFHPLISLIIIFSSCSKSTTEYKKIAIYLHRVECTESLEVEVHRLLEKFSLQFMSLRIQFGAWNIFEFSNNSLMNVSS
jgi:hypothetical protein